MAEDTTIAALATAPGAAGIAVIRISGDGAITAAEKIASGAVKQKAGTFRLRKLFDPRDNSFIDEALVLVFRAPRSFTGEDSVEFQLHGGRAVVARTLSALYFCGVEPAGPGEFSKRAFLNGKMSLDKAEAVMDLVGAQGERAARTAAEQLSGALGRALDEAWQSLVSLCADVEATLDFVEEETPGLLPAEVFCERADAIKEILAKLSQTEKIGKVLREGALVVLSGPANAGKSTLFNALLGANRAIVSPEEGTTRDSIEETLLLDGIPFRLVDTAGIRETGSSVEGEGIRRARELAERADIVIRLLAENENEKSEITTDDKTIIVRSKSDLGLSHAAGDKSPEISISAVTGQGLDKLKRALLQKVDFGKAGAEGSAVAVSERHAALLRGAVKRIAEAEEIYSLEGEDSSVIVASKLREAAEEIGKITGRVYTDEMLDAVFGKFCIGK